MIDIKERSSSTSLAFAVIKQAYIDIHYTGKDMPELKAREDAIKWILKESKEENSFVYWCSVINLDPGALRDYILKSKISDKIKRDLDNLFKHYRQLL